MMADQLREPFEKFVDWCYASLCITAEH